MPLPTLSLRQPAQAVAVAAIVVAAGFVVTLLGGWSRDPALWWLDELTFIVPGAFAAACTGWAARAEFGRRRIAWTLLTAGLVAWTVGNLVWMYYESYLRQPPFPSPADIGYLAFPVFAGMSLLMFAAHECGPYRARLLLDGCIVAGALFVVSWALVMRTVVESAERPTLATVLSLAYPAADVVVVTMAVLVLTRARGRRRATLLLLASGLAAVGVSDTVFAYLTAHDRYVSGGPTDVGWVVGLLLLAIAGLLERRLPAGDEDLPMHVPSWIGLWLPYVPLLMAGVVVTVEYVDDMRTSPVLPVSLGVVTAVLMRQFAVVRENRRLLTTVAEQALRDPLTGLANSGSFNERLADALRRRQRTTSVAVLVLDLNDFKLINDSLGHHAGDEVLVEVARRLRRCVADHDVVARLGGDEFAVLVQSRTDRGEWMAERVVEAFDDPIIVDDQELVLRVSVGLAAAPPRDRDLSAPELLRRADTAMYAAKRRRTRGVAQFSASMPPARPSRPASEGGAAQVRLLGELREAIEQVDLCLVYQPKVRLSSGEVVGVEALLRWPHVERGMLPPQEFLPLVRRHGLMRSITDLVLDRALDEAARWQAGGYGVPVAVNLFAPSLVHRQLPGQILRALADRGLPGGALTVEITEDLYLDDMARSRAALQTLRERGVQIAVDDFGSGYSALRYLRELPIDELKLDREFITPVVADARAGALVRSVIDLAHGLGITVTAEGVEDGGTERLLRTFGCDVAQGYHYSAPLDSDGIRDLLRRRRVTSPSAPAAAKSS
ncbi:bifunctional diguanylate cyclase/phosphodiesterase [Mycobacterium sp. MYCO198283]|uniref:putative bifunctional diguanylate cyclase/phosphodiesterase n=1 Tax=Mycobacterium sp. MYCO198283 TaxID=2883505 RepID=UPI001E38428C|nr:bifunctional diguanylate cyclase/phosphodiesterase [Mycobacterium sp. MYCO198283]MCG5433917.1 bifunctional diguanylate cyclase/phosphodiesterase [Mycobacterium sp. MYCO198283]